MLIGIGGKVVYHLGDTALFSDLKLVAGRGDPVDVALMCIGGHYTMDRIDAYAAEFVGAGTVIPCHDHLPADRDRRSGVQVGGRVADLVEGGGAGAGRDVQRVTPSWAPRANQTGRSFQSCATSAAPSAASRTPVAP